MKLYSAESNKAILKDIGTRLKERRISLSITQKELSELSGVSLRTIANIENGKNASFDNIISILKKLKMIENISLLFPETKIDPIALLTSKKKRQRATKPKDNSDWKWGDEK
ncbi:MAG TPA: helix-turn-helix domain-containing protein [Bacilli bacterium]|nr:helix-turn-helix domain-containing protein [Bacilli bacterium]